MLQTHGELTRIEQRTVLALDAERRRLIAELQEVDQAIQAQINSAAARLGLPDGQYVATADGGQLFVAEDVPDSGGDNTELT